MKIKVVKWGSATEGITPHVAFEGDVFEVKIDTPEGEIEIMQTPDGELRVFGDNPLVVYPRAANAITLLSRKP